MGLAGLGDDAAPGRALQETELKQIGLHHPFESGRILPQTRRQGIQPHRTAAVAIEKQAEQSPVTGIQPAAIDPVEPQGPIHQIRSDAPMAAHHSHIPHPAQQAIGDAGGAAAAASHLQGGAGLKIHGQQAGGALHDGLEIGQLVKLEPLDQAEAVPQG